MLDQNYEQLFGEKLAEFRSQKNISARKMSLDLGFSDSYINKIENGKTLPGMAAFFHICYYLNVDPKYFFEQERVYPVLLESAVEDLAKLNLEQQQRILGIVKDLVQHEKKD